MHSGRQKKAAKHALHASEVEKIAEIAFPRLHQASQERTTLNWFTTTLGNNALQCHLLAVAIIEVVHASKEFLQVERMTGQPGSVEGSDAGKKTITNEII